MASAGSTSPCGWTRLPQQRPGDRPDPDPHGQRGARPVLARRDIETDEGYTFVRREQLQRYAVLQMDVRGRDVDGFVREANARIAAEIKLPEGYWIEWGGAFENQQRAIAGSPSSCRSRSA